LFGTVDLPTSTMVMQYHRDFPIIHRICASSKNGHPMELLGIEVFRHPARRNDTPLDTSGSRWNTPMPSSRLTVFAWTQDSAYWTSPHPGARPAGDDHGQRPLEH
jgi:hypothetical protein